MNKNCIIILCHITNKNSINILKRCIDSINSHSSKKHTILLCSSGDISLIQKEVDFVDHYMFTSINTVIKNNTSACVYYAQAQWQLNYVIPAPRYYWGFAHMQKLGFALHGAISLGYENFLVMNYDSIVDDNGFIDYMFNQDKSVFFKFDGSSPEAVSADICKLNLDAAKNFIEISLDEKLFRNIESKRSEVLVEQTIVDIIDHFSMDIIKLRANSSMLYQISPFKVILNASHNGSAMAGIMDNTVYILVTGVGHPRYTLNGKIEIGYNNKFTEFDVSNNTSLLHPVTEYTEEDIEVVVRTSFGEEVVTITNEALKNSSIHWN